MGTHRWRAFFPSIRRDPNSETATTAATSPENPPAQHTPSPPAKARPPSCLKLTFFSGGSGATPSAPRRRLDSSVPILLCRTKAQPPDGKRSECEAMVAGAVAAPRSQTPPPRLTVLRKISGLFQSSSTPSSPRSPSRFALLKASLLSRRRCGICEQSVMSEGQGGGTAAGAAGECSHVFPHPCAASHAHGGALFTCPTCSASWRQVDPLAEDTPKPPAPVKFQSNPAECEKPQAPPLPNGKAYDDDEPLPPSTSSQGRGGRFNPIPEVEEDEDGESGYLNRWPPPAAPGAITVTVSVAPAAALVSSGRRHANYVVVLKVKAPPLRAAEVARGRASIDLVTVVDVAQLGVDAERLQVLKRAVRQVIASLGPADRLSIVAFSGAAKRLMPLRRMSKQGQRAARQIVDRVVLCSAPSQAAGAVGDALRKAAKVLEDRREHNPVATVMLLSGNQQQLDEEQESGRHIQQRGGGAACAAPTRFAHMEIRCSEVQQGVDDPLRQVEHAFTQCVGGHTSVIMQDARLQLVFSSGEVVAVYSAGSVVAGTAAANCIRLGDLYAEEERELMVELRVELHHHRVNHHPLYVTCTYQDPTTHEPLAGVEQPLVLPPLRSSSSSLRLRNAFVTARAVAESRRLMELSDYVTALHLLSSAHALVLQSAQADDHRDLIQRIEAEEANIRRRSIQQQPLSPSMRMWREAAEGGGRGPLTPTSAWRAAEQLAKVAIMRKSLNRVSDLHGFENARF